MKILLLSAALLSASAINATTTVAYDWSHVLTNETNTANVYDAVPTSDGNWFNVFGTGLQKTLKWSGEELTLPADKTGTASKALITKTSAKDGSLLWTITSTYGAFTFENGHTAIMPDGGAVIAFSVRSNVKSGDTNPLATLVDAKGNTVNITIADYPSTWAYVPVIMKFSADGEIEWWRNLKHTYGTSDISIKALVTDENGNIYIGGAYKSELSFPTSATEWGSAIAATNNATTAMYIAKLDKDCNIVKTFTVDASAAYATSDQVQRLAYDNGTLYWVGSVTGLTDGTTYTIGNTTVTPSIATVNDAPKALPTNVIGSLTSDLTVNWTTVIESQLNTAASPSTVIQNKDINIGNNAVYIAGSLNGGMKVGDVQLKSPEAKLFGFVLGFDKTTGAVKGGNIYGSGISVLSGAFEDVNNGHILTYGYLMTPAKIFINELDESYANIDDGETTILSLGTTSGYAFNRDTNQFISLSYGKGGNVLTDAAELGSLSAFSATVVACTLKYDATDGISTISASEADGINIYGETGAAVFTTDKAQNVAVYSATGALIKVAAIAEGSTTVELPAGFYIAAGQKFIVR